MASSSNQPGFDDNWRRGKSVTECNLHMLETEDLADVDFLVGSEKRRVRAHRYVLASRSSVFHAMLYGPLAEQSQITIPDIEANVFKDFLSFLYTDVVNINSKNATGLMYTARKYDVEELLKQTDSYLKSSLSEENLCEILKKSHLYGETDLKEKSMKMLVRSSRRVIQSQGFVDLCKSCLASFLTSRLLKLSEEDIFEAVLSWTKAECERQKLNPNHDNMRKVLGRLVYEIRFASMSHKFLTNVVGSSGMLKVEERMQIVDRKVNAEIDISPFKADVRKTKNVNPLDNGIYIVNRFQSRRDRTFTDGKHSIGFSTNRPITLLGCQLYALATTLPIKFKIELLDDQENDVCPPVEYTDRTLYTTVNEFLFPSPVSIQAGRAYFIYVDLPKKTKLFGVEGSQKMNEGGVEFTFSESIFESKTTVEKGQIPALIWKLRNT